MFSSHVKYTYARDAPSPISAAVASYAALLSHYVLSTDIAK